MSPQSRRHDPCTWIWEIPLGVVLVIFPEVARSTLLMTATKGRMGKLAKSAQPAGRMDHPEP